MQVSVYTVGALSSDSSQAVDLGYSKPPIHRLPVELLQDVFLLIIKDMPDYPSIFSLGETTVSGNFACPPLLFTRVCRLWRAVAYSTTGTWSHIKVGLPRNFPLKPFLPSLFRSWLAWSGSQLPTIRIECICLSDYGHLCPSNTQLLEILFTETTRWETVFCMCDSDVFERSENFNAPQLRTLQCSWLLDVTRFNAPNLCRIRFGPTDRKRGVSVPIMPTWANYLDICCQDHSTNWQLK
ncbi:hypothetical protein BDR06DRAFT_958450 [Suillus hirtellus]|nr:hypothetical protein BDR06DRAFT_958450 [Suillus hirtellus]